MGQTDMVHVVDTWNVAAPLRLNQLDANQVRTIGSDRVRCGLQLHVYLTVLGK